MVFLKVTKPEILERYSSEEYMSQFQDLDKILLIKPLTFFHKNTYSYR